ncbi:hypothetical protein [Burkholderia pyrrocinia]|uniref:hypothetical protein n=1 Tax=Burkholderia pyrrocinia TaxID=60550 RepID=UPI001BCFB7CA|nr:hypothetical protein [Burkholderia pyrrocinia]QVN18272.1 hypothetical protein JYG32_00575 [Burkholderia pyrrocinia]
MRISKTAVLVTVAFLPTFAGFILIGSALTSLQSFTQLDRLISFGYMSFVDSLEAGGQNGAADSFFFGIGFLLLGSLVLTKSPSFERLARRVACALFLFLAFCLAYVCIHPRIGEVPDRFRAVPEAK